MLKRLIAIPLAIVLFASGCQQTMKVGETRLVTPSEPPIKTWAAPNFGIYPSSYRVNGYVNGATLELVFTLYNDLDYSSPMKVEVVKPSAHALSNNKGYSSWDDGIKFCELVTDDVNVPPNSSKDVTIRVAVPEGNPNEVAWMFYVSYQSMGHMWGSYINVGGNNFVFYPGGFTCNSTTSAQTMQWLTWGNSATIQIRRSYDLPPKSITDGELVYMGDGEQVMMKWLDPQSNLLLDRQYTKFVISDNQQLGGNDKVFYRAWQKHLVRDVWDGTWDAIGQSLIVPEVQAKVLIGY